jgi:TetR/AcrR family transcriptional regulator, cholesterol catabolism regulator
MDRNTILNAAAQIFSQKGYHAASMQDIAASVRLQKASLYHHVSSKQEILALLLDKALDLLIERLSGVVDQPVAPEVKLRNAMVSYLSVLSEHKELASILLLEHRSLEPHLQSRHNPRRNRFEKLWRDLIQEGLEADVYCFSDPSLAAKALLGVMNWTITWYKPDGPLSAEEIALGYWNLFMKGLLIRNGN